MTQKQIHKEQSIFDTSTHGFSQRQEFKDFLVGTNLTTTQQPGTSPCHHHIFQTCTHINQSQDRREGGTRAPPGTGKNYYYYHYCFYHCNSHSRSRCVPVYALKASCNKQLKVSKSMSIFFRFLTPSSVFSLFLIMLSFAHVQLSSSSRSSLSIYRILSILLPVRQ